MSHVFAQRAPEVGGSRAVDLPRGHPDPALRDSATEALRQFEQLAVRVLSRLGVDGAEPLAASIIALIAGTALRRQSGQYTEQEEARLMTTAIRGLVAAHVLGEEKVAALLKR